jgi:hypothetical protein
MLAGCAAGPQTGVATAQKALLGGDLKPPARNRGQLVLEHAPRTRRDQEFQFPGAG